MNSLSWFIYAIQLSDNFRLISWIALVLCAITLVVLVAIFLASLDSDDSGAKEANRFCVRMLKWVVPVFIVALLGAAGLPSRQTMILIAGSEVGERVVKSEAVQGVVNPGVDLLKTWIKTETDRLTKEATGK